MKKKSFAAFLSACITVTTVLSPFESVPAFAAQEKEVPAVAAQTEAAETTENTETSETSDDTETTETSDDTEETEDTESTEEDELVGDVDKVSDIINVDVMTSTRNHYFTDAGKTIQKEYCCVQLEVSTLKTNYIVAVVVDESNYENDRSATTPYVGNRIDSQGKSVEVHYGNYNDVAASDVITMETYVTTPPVPDLKSEKNKISMIFSPSNVANHITGHEIYRKNKKGKYQKVATTTSLQYTDTGLEEGKTYQYKVRVYVYQKEKKKKVYSGFVFFSAETSTKTYLDVIAVMTGKNSVKVKWNKVPGVTKYEVYRSSTSSKDTVDAAKTDGVLSNSKWKLIKTIKSAKTVSCTDKKLNTGETYSYLVCAYYKEGKDTKRILEGASVNLKLYPVTGITGKFKKDSLKMSWDKNYFVKKYQIYRSTKKNKGYQLIATTKKTTYIDKKVKKKKTYYYKVKIKVK